MYLVFDLETENHSKFKRFANQFVDDNWVVMRGWKHQGDTHGSMEYFPEKTESYLAIPDKTTLLVGHNIKFDLLWEWGSKDMRRFLKRGGKIWCTQYAEYLLEGAQQSAHMVAMDQITEKYGGRKKIDAVKALWDAGFLTSAIQKNMLEDYLIGTREEGRNSGDIGNTELIFLGQIKRASELGMLTMIQARMDGLLATTEMEYNGLKIDIQEALRKMKLLNAELAEVESELEQYMPEMPEECPFNWNSLIHKSVLLFGGAIKYDKQAPYKDDDGNWVRYKASESWPLIGGVPTDPKGLETGEDGLYPGQDVFVSGVKKGSGKFKKVDVPGEIKVKYQPHYVYLPGYTDPDENWKSSLKDGDGDHIYSTNADVIEILGTRDIPFLKALSRRQDITKDLGTYYLGKDSKGQPSGMLTCVMPGSHIIHHSLNHVGTVTTRLSSSNPNLQNVPKASTSEVKKMFISRFLNGSMLEADYSQLEVIVQGVLSRDKALCNDLRNKIDFHCKRVSITHRISYEEAVRLCKTEAEENPLWASRRNDAKIFSFQRAYGAGAAKISATTGIPLEEVEALIEAEEVLYPGVVHFNEAVANAVEQGSKKFKDLGRGGNIYRRGYWTAPTGTRYCFRSYDAPEWLQKRGIRETFSPTEMKNYPVQGTGGEIVQIMLGKLFRRFVETDNYGGKALLCNTVHDCVWIDCDNSVLDQVARDVKDILEDVPNTLLELYGMKVTVPFPVEVGSGPNLYDTHVINLGD